MSFFMVDDQLHVNIKVQRLIDMAQPGMAALGLWTVAGSQVQAQGGDGQVLPSAWRLLGDKRLFNKLARLLVDVGLWEERDTGEEGFQYHDWFDIGYSPGEKVKLNRKRAKELKNPDIINAVKARDGENCRYCGRLVDWKDRKSDKGATYDHVIPGLPAGATNIVVACLKCNRKKAQRTPEQAAMTLLPPPNGPDSRTRSGLDPDQIPDQISAIPHRTRSRARSGSGLGEGDEQGQPDEVTNEVGPAGAAPPIELSPGHTGSPWHNHHGPPPDVDEPKCPDHGLDLPCRKCTADHYRSESDSG